jgi:hypothetical protein
MNARTIEIGIFLVGAVLSCMTGLALLIDGGLLVEATGWIVAAGFHALYAANLVDSKRTPSTTTQVYIIERTHDQANPTIKTIGFASSQDADQFWQTYRNKYLPNDQP